MQKKTIESITKQFDSLLEAGKPVRSSMDKLSCADDPKIDKLVNLVQNNVSFPLKFQTMSSKREEQQKAKHSLKKKLDVKSIGYMVKSDKSEALKYSRRNEDRKGSMRSRRTSSFGQYSSQRLLVHSYHYKRSHQDIESILRKSRSSRMLNLTEDFYKMDDGVEQALCEKLSPRKPRNGPKKQISLKRLKTVKRVFSVKKAYKESPGLAKRKRVIRNVQNRFLENFQKFDNKDYRPPRFLKPVGMSFNQFYEKILEHQMGDFCGSAKEKIDRLNRLKRQKSETMLNENTLLQQFYSQLQQANASERPENLNKSQISKQPKKRVNKAKLFRRKTLGLQHLHALYRRDSKALDSGDIDFEKLKKMVKNKLQAGMDTLEDRLAAGAVITERSLEESPFKAQMEAIKQAGIPGLTLRELRRKRNSRVSQRVNRYSRRKRRLKKAYRSYWMKCIDNLLSIEGSIFETSEIPSNEDTDKLEGEIDNQEPQEDQKKSSKQPKSSFKGPIGYFSRYRWGVVEDHYNECIQDLRFGIIDNPTLKHPNQLFLTDEEEERNLLKKRNRGKKKFKRAKISKKTLTKKFEISEKIQKKIRIIGKNEKNAENEEELYFEKWQFLRLTLGTRCQLMIKQLIRKMPSAEYEPTERRPSREEFFETSKWMYQLFKKTLLDVDYDNGLLSIHRDPDPSEFYAYVFRVEGLGKDSGVRFWNNEKRFGARTINSI